MEEQVKLTPLLEQYFEIKKETGDALLLIQVGDFYEMMFEDAKIASRALTITLTRRGKFNGQDIPLCGVPVGSINHHLAKLVGMGFKVAVCDQVSLPMPGEIVKRKVTKILTPGTLIEDMMLDEKKASFVCSVWPGQRSTGLIFAELLGSRLFATTVNAQDFSSLENEINKFAPDEILLPPSKVATDFCKHLSGLGFYTNLAKVDERKGCGPIDFDQYFSFTGNQFLAKYRELLSDDRFKTLLSFADLHHSLAMLADFLDQFHDTFLPSVSEVIPYRADDFLHLNSTTQRTLDIVRNSVDGSRKNSLLGSLDKCKTPMGSRYLKHCLTFPLKDFDNIVQRHDFVEELSSSSILLEEISELLQDFPDLERISSRLTLGRAGQADLLSLIIGLERVEPLAQLCSRLRRGVVRDELAQNLPKSRSLLQRLKKGVSQDLQQKILPGYSDELDKLRNLVTNSREEILKMELSEQEQTKIPSLRIKYTDISGYFIEMNPNHQKMVPERYQLLQMLTNKNRYVTAELKNLETQINSARQRVEVLEKELLVELMLIASKEVSDIRKIATSCKRLDVFYSFAKVARENSFCRPKMIKDDSCIKIKDGKHFVVASNLIENFIPNDVELDGQNKMMIITGPNMGGKSTYLRQVAQAVILAQAGSFVPASSCELSIHDQIFTRIGSGDDLIKGRSTFFVEMEEVAQICKEATKDSLIILDEVGRGTSTFDGMAIAQAILEFLYEEVGAKTLFATHYHELTELSNLKPGVKNYFMDCLEKGDDIVFLHKLKSGAAKESFGVSIAKLAGIPKPVISRAHEILKELRSGAVVAPVQPLKKTLWPEQGLRSYELEITSSQKKALDKIKKLDLNEISPKQAYQILEDFLNSL